MDLTLGTMLLTSYATSMYRNIKTFPSLNRIAQYFNGKKKPHLPVNTMIRILRLMYKTTFPVLKISTG